MKIGFLLPANYALTSLGNGVRVQAQRQTDALRQLGHEVVCLDAWNSYPLDTFDAIQFFSGGFSHFGIEGTVPQLAWAPIIDTNEPNWRYRWAARAGHLKAKVYTIPGVFRDQAQGCKLVICRSTHERERIVRGLGIDRKRTEIVLNGVNPPEPVDPQGIRARLNLPERFLLHVSTYTQKRKNTVRLAEAAVRAKLPLVFAGTATQGEILDKLKALAAHGGDIRLLGFQDQASLNSLYAACTVFCLPSYHEGTGLVALEAASYGARIVITRKGGPPDYFGDFAEYVDPHDTADIQRAIARAWEQRPSDNLQRHVLQNLTWQSSAMSLVEAYRKHRLQRRP